MMNATLQDYRQMAAPVKNTLGKINDGLYGMVEGAEYGLTSLFGGVLGTGGKMLTLGLSKAMTGNADLDLGRLVERKINGAMIREPQTAEGRLWQYELDRPRSVLGSKPASVMSFIPDVATELSDKFINEPWNLGPVSREVVNTVTPFLVPVYGGKAIKTVTGEVGKAVRATGRDVTQSVKTGVNNYLSRDLGGLNSMPWEDYSTGRPYTLTAEIPYAERVHPEYQRYRSIDENRSNTADSVPWQRNTVPPVTRKQILEFIDRKPAILEDGTPNKAIYHFSNEARSEAIPIAEKFINNFGKYSRDNPMTGKFGHKIYFEPERRALERLKSHDDAWMEYALHSISSKNGKDYNIRFGDDSKLENIGNIESVIKDADSYYKENGKTYYVKRVRDGKKPNAVIVLEISRDGKFEDYRYVTHLPNRK